MDKKETMLRNDAIEKKAEGAMIYVACVIDKKLKQEAESLMESSKDITISESLNARLEQLIKETRVTSAKTRRKKIVNRASKVCAILLIGVLLFCTIAIPTEVQAFKLRLFELFTHEKEKYNVLDFGQVNADVEEIIPAEWEGYYYPDYLPSGEYKLETAKEIGTEKILTFSDGKDTIYFSQKNTIDGEDENEILSDNQYNNSGMLEIDHVTVYWFKTGRSYQVYWHNTTTTFYIKTICDEEEIEKIVKSLAFKK